MPSLLQQLNTDLAAIVSNTRRGLVQINNGQGGQGAGALLHADGLIITNAHVAGRHALTVTLPDNSTLPASLLAIDEERDLAALSILANGLPAIELGNSNQLRPGELVMALGHPWGVRNAVSTGPVIGVGLPPELPRLTFEFVQAGLQLRPGHSGGPMVDATGRLVGVNTLIIGPEVGLAIPSQDVKQFLRHAMV